MLIGNRPRMMRRRMGRLFLCHHEFAKLKLIMSLMFMGRMRRSVNRHFIVLHLKHG